VARHLDAQNYSDAISKRAFTAFHETTARLYEKSSDNFLGLKITFAKFDPTMQRRVQCITINETKESNLGFGIENKPISIMEFQVKMNKAGNVCTT
jgi:hypothetical protein